MSSIDCDARVPLLQEKQSKRSIGLSSNKFDLKTYDINRELDYYPDCVSCIFIVAFDVRAGNVIEWQQPKEFDLSGIEFKALASGSHKVRSDFIYFKKEEYYGYACFESMQVNTDNERGIRMKSLGIMGHSYIQLPKFHTFLAKQLKKILEKPRYYEELVTFYLNAIKKNGDLSKYSSLSDVKVNGPGASFGHFVNFFGENVMLLWKVALLRKRILFFSPPPIGVVCYRVYSTCCLVFHDEQEFSKNLLTPLFYVNVADIPLLGIEKSFVACTTEKIFETKPHLYDAYVDNQNLVLISPQLKKILNINRADRHRFSELCKFRQEFILPSLSSCDRVNADIDDGFNWFKVYFMHTNNILLSTLLNVSRSPNRLWTREHMELTNLDPVHDRAFVEQLAVTYGLDIMVAGCGDALWDSTCSRLCCAAT